MLAHQIQRFGRDVMNQKSFILIVAMLILVLAGQFIIQPVIAVLKAQVFPMDVMQSALASQFKMMHGLASILYLLQSILGLALVIITIQIKNI
jgi:hypothetical protein